MNAQSHLELSPTLSALSLHNKDDFQDTLQDGSRPWKEGAVQSSEYSKQLIAQFHFYLVSPNDANKIEYGIILYHPGEICHKG